ncbi:MAG TPA: hypothetical protein DEV64_03235 [Rhodospirillaceae bacterium]|nr:hypothetical protein [Rhodospirillaceae bacterium]|tara:strand:+ start:2857 stop:3753 length:897 start_codon:yes stop_codon:yes gene_type:complete
MEIRHFRHFLAVADELNFSRAAERMNMGQAPLSQSIRRFENNLGVKLFDRSQRGGTRLTPAGDGLVEEARRAIAQFDTAVAKARGTDREVRGRVSVGFVTAGLLRVLPAAIRNFNDQHAGVDIRLTEGMTAGLIDAVADRSLDLALTNAPPTRPPEVHFELLRRDRTLVALPKSHLLAGGERITIKDLAPFPAVFFPRESSPNLYDALMQAFADNGSRPKIEQEARLTPTILSLIDAGLGYAFVQESAQYLPFNDVVFRPVADLSPGIVWDLHLAQPRDGTSSGARVFAGELRAAAGL